MVPHLHPKQILNGYEIETLIGKGGMGEVYRARQLNLDRIVALKVLPPDIARQDPDYAQRFIEEAQAAGALNHPNIVAVYNVGKAPLPDARPEDPEINFFAMEYVNGKTVQYLIDRKGALPQALIDRVMVGAIKALIYAEAHGIIHRDIKPDNIMITTDGVVKLADLGLALRVDTNNGPTTDSEQVNKKVMGTPLYMSPEQARGKTIDSRSDQYSLGATLYHMLTGQPPYHGQNSIDILRAHVLNPVPDPKVLNPHVSEAWRQMCMTMMAKSPDERYTSSKALPAVVTEALRKNTPSSEEQTKPSSEHPGRSRYHRQRIKRRAVTGLVRLGMGAAIIIALIIIVNNWDKIMPSEASSMASPQEAELPTVEPPTAEPPTADPVVVDQGEDPDAPVPQDVFESPADYQPPTQFSIARIDKEYELHARMHAKENRTEIIYGTTDNPWYLQDFVGENMTITEEGLNWKSAEKFTTKTVRTTDLPSLQWRKLMKPPFRASAEMSFSPGTQGVFFGVDVKTGKRTISTYSLVLTGIGRHQGKAQFLLYTNYNKKEILYEENTERLLSKGDNYFHTLDFQVDSDYSTSFFLNGELIHKLGKIDGGTAILPLLRMLRKRNGVNTVTIKTFKLSGILAEDSEREQ